MTENELHYRQSVIALIALSLLLLVVIAAFHFFGPMLGGAALAAATPFGVAFFRALPQIGQRK